LVDAGPFCNRCGAQMTTKTSQPPRQVMEQRVGTNIGWIAIGTLIILIVLLALALKFLTISARRQLWMQPPPPLRPPLLQRRPRLVQQLSLRHLRRRQNRQQRIGITSIAKIR